MDTKSANIKANVKAGSATSLVHRDPKDKGSLFCCDAFWSILARICTTAAGEGIQPNSLTHEFADAVGETTLPRVRFHDLRHAHATHMLASGVHPKVASERLGHSKVGITLDLYSHVLPGMQEDAVAKVDALFTAAQKAT